MLENKSIFFKKKILIYGLGKSGLSSYNFLKLYNEIYLYDDKKINSTSIEIKKKIISYKKLIQKKFDCIIISPGINIKNCQLRNFLKKSRKKIYTDLDIFFSQNSNNKIITITGTNGKSTTVQILYDILKKEKIDVRLVGNIGNAILSEKKVTNKSVFVIEASSYQLEYSKIFKTNIAAILNISPDHLERHGTLQKYIKAKFRLIKNQILKDLKYQTRLAKKKTQEIGQMAKKRKLIDDVTKQKSQEIVSQAKKKGFKITEKISDKRHVLGSKLKTTAKSKIQKTVKAGKSIKVSKKENDDILFAYKIVKHMKSNAIVLVKNKQTVGIGIGQMNRFDATKIAIMKYKDNFSCKNYICASDAFFPFTDSLKILFKNHCSCIVQPSGSINDEKVIKYVNINKKKLLFANKRVFKH